MEKDDEKKPVRCGCGGEAKIDYIFIETYSHEHDCPVDEPVYRVYCKQCGISTPCAYPTEAEAVTAWNRAMGIAEKSLTVERTANAEYSNADGEYLCSECGRVVQIEDAYCCGCGARLEWE